jgi:predicted membrane metal-binding protein
MSGRAVLSSMLAQIGMILLAAGFTAMFIKIPVVSMNPLFMISAGCVFALIALYIPAPSVGPRPRRSGAGSTGWSIPGGALPA